MTTPTELYQAGRLQAAIDAQIQDVKAHPADHGKRLFLFELLAFAGEWDRARRQVEAVSYPNDLALEAAVSSYKKIVDAEDHRRRVFRDGVMPEFLIPAPEWVFLRLQAVAAMKGGNAAEARDLLAKSDEAAKPVAGTLNGKPVEGVRDCDDVFGPVLEVFAHGGYFWVPLEQVDAITGLPPKFPRDLIWFPVKLSVKNGPAGDAFIPCLYPGTGTAVDDAIRLGRATDWTAPDDGPVRGSGLRQILAGEDPVAVPEVRELLLS